MKINRKVVFKPEDYASERVALSAFLYNKIVVACEHLRRRHGRVYNLACLSFPDEIAAGFKIACVASMSCHAFLDDALGDNPLGVDVNALDVAVEERCLRLH